MDVSEMYHDEFYSFLTGRVSTAIGRRLQRNFKLIGLNITAEQWSVLYFLWNAEESVSRSLHA